ncbi:patatin-like phospholipase family protein [Clostridium sp.]|uniref:patatin-like phospholipase family protein n=1 Tax=Clostridium sp. TaxID=1506 RepID=UPI003464572A
MNVDLVFEGGGVLGVSHAGAYKAISDRGYSIQRCAGTSAGAVMATLIAAGYSSEEIVKILYSIDFKTFMKKTKTSKILGIGKPLSVIFNKGVFDSSILENWMEDLLKDKGIRTFKDLMKDGESKVKIIAADITRKKMIVLPEDLKDYEIDPLDFSVAKAVRMSCAIPFYFTPVVLKSNGKDYFIVDGGLLSNFPVWIFDKEGTPRWPTFGIRVKDLESNTAKGKKGILSYTKDVFSAPLNQSEDNFIRHRDFIRTIILDNDNSIKSTDFKEANKYINHLFTIGYKSTVKFIESWDFQRYRRAFKVI